MPKYQAKEALNIARRHLRAFLTGTLWFSGALFIAVLIFTVVPKFEEDMFPAFGPVEITVLNREATDHHEFHIIGDVLRSCKYIRIGAMVKVDGVWVSGHIKTPDIPPDFMIPRGHQNFGRLMIYPKGDGVRVIVENQCHPFWINHTYYDWP